MKKKKTRRTQPPAHKFDLDCACDSCDDTYARVSYHYHLHRRIQQMGTPVTYQVYDDHDLDQLMKNLGVRDEAQADFRQALIDTAEPGKAEPDWTTDAGIVLLIRRGEVPPPPVGSPGWKYLHLHDEDEHQGPVS